MVEDRADAGGDPACWLHRVCPECGQLAEDPAPAVCRNCGSDLTERA